MIRDGSKMRMDIITQIYTGMTRISVFRSEKLKDLIITGRKPLKQAKLAFRAPKIIAIDITQHQFNWNEGSFT